LLFRPHRGEVFLISDFLLLLQGRPSCFLTVNTIWRSQRWFSSRLCVCVPTP